MVWGQLIGAGIRSLGSYLGNRGKTRQSPYQQNPWNALSGSVVEGLGSVFPGMVLGKDTDNPTDPVNAGLSQKAFMDAAYPGTNPWERLGGSPAQFAVAAEQRKFKQEEKLQDKQLKTQKDIARLNADTQLRMADLTSATSRLNVGHQVGATVRGQDIHKMLTVAQQAIDRHKASSLRMSARAALGQMDAALKNAVTQAKRQKVDQYKSEADVARNLKNPIVAMLARAAKIAYDNTDDPSAVLKHIDKTLLDLGADPDSAFGRTVRNILRVGLGMPSDRPDGVKGPYVSAPIGHLLEK